MVPEPAAALAQAQAHRHRINADRQIVAATTTEIDAALDVGEPPATSAVATTTIPEPLEDAVAAIEAREQAETEAESVETVAGSAESRLEVLEAGMGRAAGGAGCAGPGPADDPRDRGAPQRVVAVDRVGAGSGRCALPGASAARGRGQTPRRGSRRAVVHEM